MVDPPQSFSPAPARHGPTTVIITYEKQQEDNPQRRPVPNINKQSPKYAERGSSLPKLAGTSATNGYASHQRDGAVEGVSAEESCTEDGVATPIKAFLSSNITPRSGSRKARAETTSPTPNETLNGTPSKSRPVSSIDNRERTKENERATSGLGLRIANTGRTSRTGSVTSDCPGSSLSSRPVLMERSNSATRVTSPENAPKFFHADDVKASIPPRPTSEQALPQGGLPGVQPKDGHLPIARTSWFSNSPTADDNRPKFFYANDANEAKSPPFRLSNGNTLSRPPLQTIYSAHAGNSPERAPSPLKEEVLPQNHLVSMASPRRHTRLISNGGSELTSPQAVSYGNGNLSRRSSLNSPKQPHTITHARSSSVTSAGPRSPRKSSIGLSGKSPIEPTRTTSLTGANGALPHSVNPPAITHELPQSQAFSQPQSPTKTPAAGQSKIDQINELAANARRERKVLDLEISNSSLLAINRTLEREMRKQSAELRRFRRLSRTGRLSVAPSRSASGKMSTLSEATEDLDDLDDDLLLDLDDDDESEDFLSNLSATSAASRASSPTARAAMARFGDPECVELDLAAHRALLLDSQKLNLSIKRCLSHSESLLASGKRALEYRAQAPEPENLGPRVLPPDDVGHHTFGQGQALLSPSLTHAMSNPWEQSLESIGGLIEGLETPDCSRWGLQSDGRTSVPDGEEPDIPALPDDHTPDEALDIGSKDPAVELDRHSPNPHATETDKESRLDKTLPILEPMGKDLDLDLNKFLPIPSLEPRRASSFISLDGLEDDEPEIPLPPPPKSGSLESSLSSNSENLHPDSYAARSERQEKSKFPDLKPGEAGFRGSMQGLGHYLQAFSMFGKPQQA